MKETFRLLKDSRAPSKNCKSKSRPVFKRHGLYYLIIFFNISEILFYLYSSFAKFKLIEQKGIKAQLAENELQLEIAILEHSQFSDLADHLADFDAEEKEYQQNVAGYRNKLEEKTAKNAISRIRKSHNDLLGKG